MKCILNPEIALRSYWLVPEAIVLKGKPNAIGCDKEIFELLQQCDGVQEIKGSPLLYSLIMNKTVIPLKKGETLNPWQKYRSCNNRYFPRINWMITGKCNYNCLHCFNAKNNERLQSEFTLEEAKKLIEEAESCGINAFTITGGEPLIHPHFLEIVSLIYEHQMFIDELNTNGYFINEEMLNSLKKLGANPLIKISFDGLGYHDWLRNHQEAEEDTIRAIKLCHSMGFKVKVQMNVHRKNLAVIFKSVMFLDSLGVEEIRIIRTTETPRWAQNAPNGSLTLPEFYESMAAFAKEYLSSAAQAHVTIWQFMELYPQEKAFSFVPILCQEGGYRPHQVICKGVRGMIAIAADGILYPCFQVSSLYLQNNIALGNVKQNGLQKYLQEGRYLEEVTTTVEKEGKENQECGKCFYFEYCQGGCPALSFLYSKSFLGADQMKCVFFKEGFLEKTLDALKEFKWLNAIPLQKEKSTT